MKLTDGYYTSKQGFKVYPILTITKEELIADFIECEDEEFVEWLKNLDGRQMNRLVSAIDDHVEVDWEDIMDGIFDVYEEDCNENAQKNKDAE